jgi:hypothetical protein
MSTLECVCVCVLHMSLLLYFTNRYEDDTEGVEQCVVVLSGLTNRSLKGLCELQGTCVSRRLAPHGVRYHPFTYPFNHLHTYMYRYYGVRHNDEAL